MAKKQQSVGILDNIKKGAKGMFKSKKFQGAIIASAIAFISDYFGVSVEVIMAAITPLLVYIGAQGIADIGKEKAKIEFDEED